MLPFLAKLFQKKNPAADQAMEKGAVIIDVRSPEEYKQGHIEGSKNIPLNEITQNIVAIKKWNKPVVTVCRSGNRSAAAADILHASGIEVYNGGAWDQLRQTSQ